MEEELHARTSLQWRHNGYDGVSNHQPLHRLLNRLYGRRSKKTSKLRVTGLCVGTSPGIGEFPAQMASNAENFPFDDVIIYRTVDRYAVVENMAVPVTLMHFVM